MVIHLMVTARMVPRVEWRYNGAGEGQMKETVVVGKEEERGVNVFEIIVDA